MRYGREIEERREKETEKEKQKRKKVGERGFRSLCFFFFVRRGYIYTTRKIIK